MEKIFTFTMLNLKSVFSINFSSRVLGGLLSAHLLIVSPSKEFQSLRPQDYGDELLNMAHDLANRLLVAFEGTQTGIPWPRVSYL